MPGQPKPCVVCERPRLPKFKYCPRCKKLVGNKDKLYRRIALIAAFSKILDGFVCSYTGVKLEENDTSSPWYLTFDHLLPRKRNTLVVSAYFINDMKSNLSGDEFRAIVMEYDRHRKGAPFNRDIVKFLYWKRKAKPEPQAIQADRPMTTYNVPACVICGHEPVPHGRYCARCRSYHPNIPGRLPALLDSWNKEQDAFLDHYIGVKLDKEDLDSPYYMVFDHRIPGKKGDLVATSMLMNAMKTDMSEEEFNLVMNELARHHEGKAFDRDVIRFEYWRRPKYLVGRN